jgi:hypothetical protein
MRRERSLEPAMRPVQLCCWIALFAFAGLAQAQATPSRRTTADGRPLASSLPSKNVQVRAQSQALAFEELARHIDDRIKLTTIYGRNVEGRVDSVSGQTLRLRISAGAGFAITNFERANIRSIIRL